MSKSEYIIHTGIVLLLAVISITLASYCNTLQHKVEVLQYQHDDLIAQIQTMLIDSAE